MPATSTGAGLWSWQRSPAAGAPMHVSIRWLLQGVLARSCQPSSDQARCADKHEAPCSTPLPPAARPALLRASVAVRTLSTTQCALVSCHARQVQPETQDSGAAPRDQGVVRGAQGAAAGERGGSGAKGERGGAGRGGGLGRVIACRSCCLGPLYACTHSRCCAPRLQQTAAAV